MPGFIVNRVARPFYGEALKILGEGTATVPQIDAAMRAAGFRMGPFELMDLIGIDVNYAVTRSVYDAFFQEPRYRPSPIQQRMVEANTLGRKTGQGFYHYPDGQPAEPAYNPPVNLSHKRNVPFIPEHLTMGFLANGGIEIPSDTHDLAEIAVRILAMIMNEAAYAVGEGVASVRDIDTAMKLGTNYPKGPLKWADEIGLDLVFNILKSLHASLGDERYRPAPLLRQMVRSGATGDAVGEGWHSPAKRHGVAPLGCPSPIMKKSSAKRGFLNARIRRRLVVHHLLLGILAANLTFSIILFTPSASSHFALSIATAYSGLIFLAATLTIGPINLLRGLRNPVSNDLRRDIGIWAAILGLLHVFVSLPLPAGNILFLFLHNTGEQPGIAPRTDIIGIANDLGLVATILTLYLLVLSNDWSLTFFGAKRWKNMQRWSYPLPPLVIAHGLGYILQEHRQSTLLNIFILSMAGVAILQLIGFIIKRKNLKRRAAPPLVAIAGSKPHLGHCELHVSATRVPSLFTINK